LDAESVSHAFEAAISVLLARLRALGATFTIVTEGCARRVGGFAERFEIVAVGGGCLV